MATINHEKTNRKVLTNKQDLNISNGWKTLINKYPNKCAICDKYIGNGIKILWHVKENIVMHKFDCLN
jgi:hypothetical protein